MTDVTRPEPDTVAATGDPGDETARRYRYQWTYAAIICCMLLDDSENVSEVFCEHHEDILIKHSDGTYSGLQIKTRGSDQGVWKTNDEAIKLSCVRFAKLERDFPNQFKAFRFLTNHPLHVAGNGQDFRHVLEVIKEADSVDQLVGKVASFIKSVASTAQCSEEIAFFALSKADASDDLPKLVDIEVRLIDTLTGVWERASDCSYTLVRQAASFLASTCGGASSLAHQDILPAYLPVTANPEAGELSARLAGKRIDLSRLLEVLNNGLNTQATLEGEISTCIEPGTGELDLLQQKLDAGGFSAVSCNSAQDLRDKADYLGLSWIKKHGREKGLQRYNHVRSIVLRDAARAFEDTKSETQKFGFQMLNELSSRFRQRQTDGDQLFGCSNEHLEGFSYSLTSQCKVCWSLDRPWETE